MIPPLPSTLRTLDLSFKLKLFRERSHLDEISSLTRQIQELELTNSELRGAQSEATKPLLRRIADIEAQQKSLQESFSAAENSLRRRLKEEEARVVELQQASKVPRFVRDSLGKDLEDKVETSQKKLKAATLNLQKCNRHLEESNLQLDHSLDELKQMQVHEKCCSL